MELRRKIKTASTDERMALWKEYFSIASNTSRIVSVRAADIEYLVKSLESLLEAVPGIEVAPSAQIAAVLGLSLGGAVATEYSKQAGGDFCVVNMDGGIYGARLEQPIDKHYLMLYSQQNSGINDSALTMTDGVEVTRKIIVDSKHLNFHDIAAIYPVLKWLGATGPADPMLLVTQRNQSVLDFVQ